MYAEADAKSLREEFVATIEMIRAEFPGVVCLCLFVYVSVCVCVRVYERETDRLTENNDTNTHAHKYTDFCHGGRAGTAESNRRLGELFLLIFLHAPTLRLPVKNVEGGYDIWG